MSDDLIEERERKIALRSGLVLNVVEWRQSTASASVPPILLIHGLGDASWVWRDVAMDLACRRRVLALDLRGHGDSGWATDADYRVTAMATDIGDLLSALSLSGVTVVGHSLGGAVALRAAVQYSERIHCLVLADFGPDADAGNVAQLRHALREAHRLYPTADDYADVLIARHPLTRPERLKWLAMTTTRRLDSGSVEPKYDPAILSKLERAGPAGETAAGNLETWRLLAGLRCRVLVLRGTGSSLLSAAIVRKMVHEALADATLRVIPLAGHSIQLDNPVAVREAIEEFLDAL